MSYKGRFHAETNKTFFRAIQMTQENLLKQLDSFDDAQRHSALGALANIDGDFPPAGENVNMHFHSFSSFNAEGYSP